MWFNCTYSFVRYLYWKQLLVIFYLNHKQIPYSSIKKVVLLTTVLEFKILRNKFYWICWSYGFNFICGFVFFFFFDKKSNISCILFRIRLAYFSPDWIRFWKLSRPPIYQCLYFLFINTHTHTHCQWCKINYNNNTNKFKTARRFNGKNNVFSLWIYIFFPSNVKIMLMLDEFKMFHWIDFRNISNVI